MPKVLKSFKKYQINNFHLKINSFDYNIYIFFLMNIGYTKDLPRQIIKLYNDNNSLFLIIQKLILLYL